MKLWLRYVLNILVATLTGKPVKQMLFKMYKLIAIMQSFNDACTRLCPDEIMYYRVWMVVTDQSSYMFNEFFNLKQMCSSLRHETCIVYSLHRVCAFVRVKYSKTKDFISEMKKVLLKDHVRI